MAASLVQSQPEDQSILGETQRSSPPNRKAATMAGLTMTRSRRRSMRLNRSLSAAPGSVSRW